MSGESKVKIGDKLFTATAQGWQRSLQPPNPKTDLQFASQAQTGISTAAYPFPLFAGTYWNINGVTPGSIVLIYNFGFHTRVEELATGAEWDCTRYSRVIMGNNTPVNANQPATTIEFDGANPSISFNRGVPVLYNSSVGIVFSIRVFLNQLAAAEGYVHAAGDTLEVAAWMNFQIV